MNQLMLITNVSTTGVGFGYRNIYSYVVADVYIYNMLRNSTLHPIGNILARFHYYE